MIFFSAVAISNGYAVQDTDLQSTSHLLYYFTLIASHMRLSLKADKKGKKLCLISKLIIFAYMHRSYANSKPEDSNFELIHTHNDLFFKFENMS